MYESNLVGIATRATGTGLRVVTSANANIIGVLCAASATATGGMQLFAGVTSSVSITGLIVFASGSVAQYVPLPVYASGGITMNVGAAANPDITLFWNPA